MKERIQALMSKEGITATTFADKIGVQRSSISHILSGRNNPSYDFIVRTLEKYPDLSANWLITGKGEMYNTIKSDSKKNETPFKDTLFGKTENDIFPTTEEYDRNVKSNDINDDKGSLNINQQKFTNVNSIEKIVIFYNNGTFKEYKPLQ